MELGDKRAEVLPESKRSAIRPLPEDLQLLKGLIITA